MASVPALSMKSTLASEEPRSRLSLTLLDVLLLLLLLLLPLAFGTILITNRLSHGACSNTFAPASSYTSGGNDALPVPGKEEGMS